jgi:large subunit ribosomal protein L21
MYAIIQDGGKQYTVTPGLGIDFERKELPSGSVVEFTQVLFVSDKGQSEIGKPFVENVKVIGVVEREVKGEKLIAFKFRKREDYHRKRGYRHKYTRIRIQKIVKE